jgi:hypothetical protein
VLGNHSEKGIDVIVDNTPPLLSLDPPAIRMGKVSMGSTTCSAPFDPVGKDAASDGDKVLTIATLRARIEDKGNWAPGLAVEHISMLDPASIKLYASPVTNGPLVVDVDGDGDCDTINPGLDTISLGMGMTSSNQALSLGLVPIPPSGSADFFSSTTTQAGCDAIMTGASAPDPLCLDSGSPMTIAIPHLHDDNVGNAAIFTIPPITPSYNCTGLQLDTRNNLPEGPTCLAVVAKDTMGNWGVSQPIRVCIDRGGGKCAGWPNPSVLPECTGTIKTGVPPTTACTAPNFGGGILLTN